MAFFLRVKKIVTPFVNFPRWMGAQHLAVQGKAIIDQAKSLVVPSKPKYHESFEEALLRLNLTEADLIQRKKQFTIYALVFVTCALGLFGYSLYLAWVGSYRGMFAGFGLTLLLLGQSFRYHFWLFQMKQRKLGCTFSEWLYYGLLRKSK